MLYPTQWDYDWAMDQFRRLRLISGIDANDLLIAAVAARLRVPLYTRNRRHFEMLPDVAVQQPY